MSFSILITADFKPAQIRTVSFVTITSDRNDSVKILNHGDCVYQIFLLPFLKAIMLNFWRGVELLLLFSQRYKTTPPSKRTSFHKGVFLGPEYLKNILGTNGHIKGTCIAANFESNGPLVWCLLCIKSGWGNSIPVLPEVIN